MKPVGVGVTLDPDQLASDDELVTRCASHPDVETRLRCGKCWRPICPRCLIYTPVGTRCRACANLKPLPIFQVGAENYARAVAAAMGMAFVGGLAWALISILMPFLSFWLILGVGYFAGESISIATNRKRGRGLQVLAAGALLFAYLFQSIFLVLMRFPGSVAEPALLQEVAVRQFAVLLSNPLLILVFALSVYIAASRL